MDERESIKVMIEPWRTPGRRTGSARSTQKTSADCDATPGWNAAEIGDRLGRPSRRQRVRPIRGWARTSWFRGAQTTHEAHPRW